MLCGWKELKQNGRLEEDEGPRKTTTIEALSKLKTSI